MGTLSILLRVKSRGIAESAEFQSIRAALKARGWQQRTLARQLGVSEAHVSNLVSGRYTPGKKLALKISRLLHVDLRALLED